MNHRPPDAFRLFPRLQRAGTAGPWVYFPVFLIANALLSYFPLPTGAKWAVLTVGIVIPLVMSALGPAASSKRGLVPAPSKDSQALSHAWWVALLALACLPRFLHLTTLSTWPTGDDGLYCFNAMELNRKWEWRIFFDYNQVPPLTAWCMALYFRIFEPSLFSLWLFPALVSLLTVGTVFYARKYFSGLFAFYLLALVSFNFPYLYMAKFCPWPVVLLFLTTLVYLLTCAFLRAPSSPAAYPQAFALGLALGIGFFAAVAWPVVAFSVTAAVLGGYGPKGRRNSKELLVFGLPLGLLGGLYAFFSWRLKNGNHIRNMFAFGPGSDWAAALNQGLHKEASLFWAASPTNCFGPLWGGMLNPVLGAAFFLGAALCLRNFRGGFPKWILASAFLMTGPALLSKGFEIFRMTQVFPLLIFIACMGFYELFPPSPKASAWKWGAFALCLCASTALDLYHLEGPYHRLWGTPGPAWNHLKSNPYWRAYGILEETCQSRGPGMVLLDLRADIHDQNLTPATYAYNLSCNPKIGLSAARWAAFIVHPDFKPFLSKAFPGGHWYWMDQDEMLGIVDLDPSNLPTFLSWYGADQQLQPVTAQILNLLPEETQQPVIGRLLEIEASLPPDRFLKSFLWEKVAYHRVADHDAAGAVEALTRASEEGFPAAHFDYVKGVLLAGMGKYGEAEKAFQKALRSPLNLSPAAEKLSQLREFLASEPRGHRGGKTPP